MYKMLIICIQGGGGNFTCLEDWSMNALEISRIYITSEMFDYYPDKKILLSYSKKQFFNHLLF